jgi:hypothetical protein
MALHVEKDLLRMDMALGLACLLRVCELDCWFLCSVFFSFTLFVALSGMWGNLAYVFFSFSSFSSSSSSSSLRTLLSKTYQVFSLWRRGVVASWDVFTTLRDYVLAALLRLTVVWISTVVYFLKKVVIECNVCFSLSVSD